MGEGLNRKEVSMSSKSKHTPGPWKAVNTGSEMVIIVAPNHPARTYVADIVRAESHARFSEQEQANAALIACAPDMYEVLRSIQKIIGSADWHSDEARVQVWAAVDKAVAKAEGRE